MARIILPNRAVQRQPHHRPAIDRGNPIGKALVGCILGSCPHHEIVTGNPMKGHTSVDRVTVPSHIRGQYTQNSKHTPQAGHTFTGLTGFHATTETTWDVPKSRAGLSTDHEMTMYWRGTSSLAVSTALNPLFSYRNDTYGWEMGWLNSDASIYVKCGSVWAGSAQGFYNDSYDWNSRQVFTMAAVFTNPGGGTGGNMEMFLNGHSDDTGSVTNDSFSADYGTNITQIRMHQTEAICEVAYVFNKALSAQEVIWLERNPYGVFKTPSVYYLEDAGVVAASNRLLLIHPPRMGGEL